MSQNLLSEVIPLPSRIKFRDSFLSYRFYQELIIDLNGQDFINENWDCTSLSNLYHFLQFELCFNHFIFLESELTELLKSFPYPLNIGLNITNYSGNFNLSKHIYDNVVFFVITKIHE